MKNVISFLVSYNEFHGYLRFYRISNHFCVCIYTLWDVSGIHPKYVFVVFVTTTVRSTLLFISSVFVCMVSCVPYQLNRTPYTFHFFSIELAQIQLTPSIDCRVGFLFSKVKFNMCRKFAVGIFHWLSKIREPEHFMGPLVWHKNASEFRQNNQILRLIFIGEKKKFRTQFRINLFKNRLKFLCGESSRWCPKLHVNSKEIAYCTPIPEWPFFWNVLR